MTKVTVQNNEGKNVLCIHIFDDMVSFMQWEKQGRLTLS